MQEEDDFFADGADLDGVPDVPYHKKSNCKPHKSSSCCRKGTPFSSSIVVTLLIVQLLLGSITFVGLVLAKNEFDSMQATVHQVEEIIPLVKDTLGPIQALLQQLNFEEIGSFLDQLPTVETELKELLALGKNITRMIDRYFPHKTTKYKLTIE